MRLRTQHRAIVAAAARILILAVWLPSGLLAQANSVSPPAPNGGGIPAVSPATPMAGMGSNEDMGEMGATMAMSGDMADSHHMVFTPKRAPSKADSARATWVLDSLRKGIAKYADVKVAEADGYKIFAPGAQLKVYHFTNRWRALKEIFRFDPGQPSSLLYEKEADGSFRLVGAMYHMARTASQEQMNRRVPLSIAQWHAHLNLCVPPKGQELRWQETIKGKPVFGPESAIETRADCTKVGGRFIPQIFGWMVHVMALETDPAKVWADDHSMHEGPSSP